MFVLDSSALIHPIGFEDAATVPEVLEEVRNRPSRLRIENAMAAGKLRLLEPSPEAMAVVLEKSGESGDSLSHADSKLVALALEQHAVLVTDDYGMQNVAKLLGVSFKPLSERGIQKAIMWGRYCPNCKKPVVGIECPSCGSATKRKARK